MTKRRGRLLLCAAILSATASVASAYDTLTEDYGICMGGNTETAEQAEAMVDACTRLIDNSSPAGKKLELYGMFLAMRVTANTDKAANCKDARQAAPLIKDPKLQPLVQDMININC